jgi:hypothetical protein
MDGVWNLYYLESTEQIYTFGILKWSEKFKVLDLSFVALETSPAMFFETFLML